MSTPYISIDIETTGLDSSFCQILEVGAVCEDWKTPVDELPVFNCYVKNTPVRGEPYALSMPHNVEILRAIATDNTDVNILQTWQVVPSLRRWLFQVGYGSEDSFTPAGKNFGSFDLQFLKKLDGWSEHLKLRHRAIDPGMIYWDPTDPCVPDMLTCMRRAGRGGAVTHTAIEDAREVIRLIRLKYGYPIR